MKLFRDPTAAYHHNNPESYQAHKSIKGDKKRLQTLVLNHIKNSLSGLTSDEIEVRTGLSHQTISARCTELLALDLIKRNGKRPTRSGRKAAVLVMK